MGVGRISDTGQAGLGKWMVKICNQSECEILEIGGAGLGKWILKMQPVGVGKKFRTLAKHASEGEWRVNDNICNQWDWGEFRTLPTQALEIESQNVQYYFHGLGIDFITEQRRYHYNYHGSDKGLGVYFTPLSIYGYDFKITPEIQEEFDRLILHRKITQWMPEIPLSKVFYLT